MTANRLDLESGQWSERVRPILIWFLILATLHCPVPFPDLDGECQGAPIVSLFERQAWHVLLIGVRPNDDIDRGPIRTSDDPVDTPTDNPFGDLPVVSTAAVQVQAKVADSHHWPFTQAKVIKPGDSWRKCLTKPPQILAIPPSRVACVSFSTWQI